MWTAYYLGRMKDVGISLVGIGICLVSVFLFHDYWNNQAVKFSKVQGEQKIDIKSDFETHSEDIKSHQVKLKLTISLKSEEIS